MANEMLGYMIMLLHPDNILKLENTSISQLTIFNNWHVILYTVSKIKRSLDKFIDFLRPAI